MTLPIDDAEHRALLEGIAAAPDDDAPRLVYADLLLSRGDRLGELIQVQCALARSPGGASEALAPPAVRELRRRQRALLRAHAPRWQAAADLGLARHEVRRGFLAHGAMPLVHFLARQDALFAAAPLLESLDLAFDDHLPLSPQYQALLASPHLGRLRALSLAWNPAEAPVLAVQLAEAPSLARLRSLELVAPDRYTVWTAAERAYESARYTPAVARLATSPHLAGLRRLRLARAPLGPAGAEALAGARFRLRELSLWTSPVEEEGAAALAAAPALDGIEHLGMVHCRVGVAGARAIGAAPGLGQLRALDLRQNRLGQRGGVAFAEGARLTALETLSLWGAGIGDAGAAALVDSPVAARLARLNLRSNAITDAGAARIAAAPALASLRQLNLNHNDIGDNGFAALAASPSLRGADIQVDGTLPLRPRPRAP